MTVSGYRIQGLMNRAISGLTHIDGSQLSLIAPLSGTTGGSASREEGQPDLISVALQAAKGRRYLAPVENGL